MKHKLKIEVEQREYNKKDLGYFNYSYSTLPIENLLKVFVGSEIYPVNCNLICDLDHRYRIVLKSDVMSKFEMIARLLYVFFDSDVKTYYKLIKY